MNGSDYADGMEQIAGIADQLDSINAMLANKSLPPAIHVEALREALPDLARNLRAAYLRTGAPDVWGRNG